MPVHAWEEIVRQIEQECDPGKIAELTKRLNDAMVIEEKEKVRHRLGIFACEKGSSREPSASRQPKGNSLQEDS